MVDERSQCIDCFLCEDPDLCLMTDQSWVMKDLATVRVLVYINLSSVLVFINPSESISVGLAGGLKKSGGVEATRM
jgi:hypothetical protein